MEMGYVFHEKLMSDPKNADGTKLLEDVQSIYDKYAGKYEEYGHTYYHKMIVGDPALFFSECAASYVRSKARGKDYKTLFENSNWARSLEEINEQDRRKIWDTFETYNTERSANLSLRGVLVAFIVSMSIFVAVKERNRLYHAMMESPIYKTWANTENKQHFVVY